MAKILIVEDDPMALKMYSEFLATEKFEVETARDGIEALEKVKSSKPSLILLDILLPKLNGNQVLEQLKADPATKNIPVIVLTNVNDIRNAQMDIQLGAIQYIVKSEFDPKNTGSLIRDVLRMYGSETKSSS